MLVVEPDDVLRQLLASTLAGSGYAVRQASHGLAALSATESFRPDVLVLDWMAPGLQPELVLDILRRENGRLPAVLLTADARAKVSGKRLPDSRVLEMPFEQRDLLDQVAYVLRHRAARKQPAA